MVLLGPTTESVLPMGTVCRGYNDGYIGAVGSYIWSTQVCRGCVRSLHGNSPPAIALDLRSEALGRGL